MLSEYIEKNRERWLILPSGFKRLNIKWILKFPDFIKRTIFLLAKIRWEKERSWEYDRYSELIKGKHVLEIGGGMGYDGMVYHKTAQSYTYAEINRLQLEFIKDAYRLIKEPCQNVFFQFLENPFEHHFPMKYQVFFAFGVLHHIPFEEAKRQFIQIDKYLTPGAKVVMLMYPKKRWENAGRPSFENFGQFTDGGCPWAEWYDEEKIMNLVGDGYELNVAKYWGFSLSPEAEFVNFELEKK